MYCKRCILMGLVLVFSGASTYETLAKKHELAFEVAKDDVWSLSERFIELLSKTFDVDIFIETGTGFGGTTSLVARYFGQVYTIELEEQKYASACTRFKNVPTVHTLHGDSGKVFATLLPKLAHKKIMFWLDGHYSGPGAGKETNTTPIVQELEAIRQSGITDAIILVDDMCCFAPPVNNPPTVAQGYPTVKQLRDAIMKINAAYEFYIYGDIAIACLPSEGVVFSPLVKAMTASRLFCAQDGDSYDDVVAVEQTLTTCATESERAALKELMVEHAGREWSVYPFLWYGLVRLGLKNSEAYNFLLMLGRGGFSDVRFYWYCQNAIQQRPDQMTLLPDMIRANDPWLGGLRKFIDEKAKAFIC